MRGAQPHSMYTTFFSSRLRSCSSDESIPESPLYCPRSEYFTILQSKQFSPQIYDLLCDMRDLTIIYFSTTEPDIVGPCEATYVPASTLASIIGRSLARQPATLPGTPVWNNWVYESCRLTALIYCHMLCQRSQLPIAISFPLNSALVHDLHMALAKTDTSDCWGDMAGVLYWCTLVGGAAMLDVLENSNMKGWEKGDTSYEKNETCRRWLSILAVRLSVVIGFQHSDIVRTTLMRFVRIRNF